MKEKRYMTIIKSLLLAAASFAFLSCSNLFGDSSSESSTTEKSSSDKAQTITITGNISISEELKESGALPAEYLFLLNQINDSNERSAFPSTTSSNYYATATKDGTNFINGTITTTATGANFTMAITPIDDTPTTWTIEAGLKDTFNTSTVTILKDTWSNDFSNTNPSFSHDFVIKPLDSGSGNIDLTISSTTSTANTPDTLELYLNGTKVTAGTGETISTSKITLKDRAKGVYKAKLVFKKNGYVVFTDYQGITVFPNMTTNTWVNSKSSITVPINGSTYTLTDTLIQDYLLTQIYVGSVTIGTSQITGNDDTGNGTVFAPYATFAKAITFLKEYGNTGKDYTIWISGVLTGPFTIQDETSPAKPVKAQSLTLSGYTGNTTDKLIGGSSGSVLYLDTSVLVTIKNLTITGGKGTEVSSILYGGGIYIAKGTVKLTDGAIIAGNTATNGGGVYLAGSDSNLFMYGSALIGAQADSYPTKAEDASNSADNGGGIYNNGGAVYLGYSKYVSSSNKTESDITAGYGIRRNYAIFYSGIQSEGGTVLIRSGSISNNGTKYNEDWKGYGGALGVTAVGTYTISGGTFSSNYARNGGVVYIKEVDEENKDNPIVVNISGGTFSNNTGVGGAVIRVQKYSKVVISGNPTFTGNNATASGGVIYNDYGIITMTGGTMGGTTDSDQNTCGAYGGAIYQSGTFNLSGSAKIYSGSTKTNDVYLSSGKKITIDANYTGSGNNDESKMSVTPNTWTRGVVILDGSKLTSTNKDYFSITDAEWNVVTTGDTTLTGHLNADLYVAGSALTIDGVSYGAGASNGKGTKSAPYSTISAAVNQCWSNDIDFTINVVGTVSGAQTMPAANETDKTGLAKSITVNGIGDNTNPAQLKNSNASILKIQNTKPITLQGLAITGTVEGGGLYILSPDADVTLNGVEIYGNQATAGGAGIYNYGTLKIADARIYNNRVTGNDYYGGGLCNKGGTVYIYGDNTVIGKADANTTATYDPVNSINDYSNVSNYSAKNGGGIYNGYRGATVNGVSTTIYGTVYIGKDPDGNLSKPKITYNFANRKGGGIYNESQCTIEFYGGEISYNSTIANQQSTAYQGGGIYSEGAFIIKETQKTKKIIGNASYQGGAIYMTGANSSLSMGGPSAVSSAFISIPYSDTSTNINYYNKIYLGLLSSGSPCPLTITHTVSGYDFDKVKIETNCSSYKGKEIIKKDASMSAGSFEDSLKKFDLQQPSGNTGYDYYISSTGVLSQPTKYTSANKNDIQPGDILMKNGDVLPFDSRMSIPKEDAIGVVFHNGTACSTNSTTRILVLGVKYRSVGLKSWSGYPESNHPTSPTSLQATASGSGTAYTISGTNAINGKNNSSYISSCTTSGNAFEACSNYASIDTNLTGTTYATGWYLPSLKELWTVRQNKTVVLTTLYFLNNAYTQEGSSTEFQHYVSQGQKTYGYWCSNTTNDSDEMYAWIVRLDDYSKETSNTYSTDLIQKGKHSVYEYVLPIHEVTF